MKVLIKNVTGSAANEGLLWELSKYAGVKEGRVIEDGILNKKNNSVSFSIGCVDCIAWVGQTCEIIGNDGDSKN